MEHVLLPRLGLAAFKGDQLGMGRTILPEIDDVVTGHDDVSLVHFGVFGLDSDSLAFDWASDCVAEDEQPLVNSRVGGVLGHQHTVFSTSNDLLESAHVLDVSLVDAGIPEDDAHIVALGLAEGKHEGLGEVAPHVVRLDVSEEDVGIHGKADTHAISFPADGVHNSAVRRHSERADVLARGRVELDGTLVALRGVEEGSSDSKDVAIGVPLDTLNEHASVDQDGHFIAEALHELESTALIGNAEGSTVFIHVFIAEALSV